MGKTSKPHPVVATLAVRKRKRDQQSFKSPGNDTPREFLRLMARSAPRRRPLTLDDGVSRSSKMRRLGQVEPSSDSCSKEDTTKGTEALKMRPRERFVDFASRVDQALPVVGLKRRGKLAETKVNQTRLERKIQRMQAAWRVDDARRKSIEEDAADAMEEENALQGIGASGLAASKKGKKRSERGRVDGGGVEDDDPWEKLKEKRGQRVAVYDVAKAPPDFKRMPKENIFKVTENAKVKVGNVPAAAGSLKRREELSRARRDVVENYRRMIKERREM